MLSGATEGAIRAAKEALALFQKEGIKNLEAAELHCIASWYLTDGDFDEALTLAEEAMDIYQEEVTADIAEATVLATMVTACLKKNQPKTALRAVKDVLERFEESGDLRGEAATHGQMCEVYCAFGDADRAVRSAMNAVDAFEALDDKVSQAKEMRSICRLYTAMQEHEKALRMAQQALELFEMVDDIKEQALTLQMRANVYVDKQEHSSALRCITEARGCTRTRGARRARRRPCSSSPTPRCAARTGRAR
jgi:tetratricopeptide (TPR) repeat protein